MSVDEGLLHAWLDGQLSPEEAARVEALIASDPAWRDAAAEARGLMAGSSRILGALDSAPSARNAVAMGRWTTSGGAGPATGPRRRVAPWMRAAAGLVLAVGVGAVVWDSQREDWFGPDGGEWVEPSAVAAEADSAPAVVTAEAAVATAAVADATENTASVGTAASAAPRPAPAAPTAAMLSREVAGGRVLSDAAVVVCLVPLDSAGTRRAGAPLRSEDYTLRADSSVSAGWTDSTGRSAFAGRQVGDTLRGTVRVSAGDIRSLAQPLVLLRVLCP